MKILQKIWFGFKLKVIYVIAFPLLLFFHHKTHIKHMILMMKSVLFKYLLIHYPEYKDKWKNSEFEISIDYATSSLCNANFDIIKDDDFIFYKKSVDDLLDKLKSIEKVKRLLAKYYSQRIFLHLLYNKFIVSNDIFKSRIIKGVLGELFCDWKGGLQFRKNLLTIKQELIKSRDFADYMDLRKEIFSEKREIDKNFTKSYSLKIQIDSSSISIILSLFSILFLITGYFYNYFLLKQYNIPVSSFFNISDYLATSVEKIRYCLFGSSIALISSFSRYRSYYGQLPWDKVYSISSGLKSFKWLIIIAGLLIGIGLIFNFSPTFYLIVSFTAIFFSINTISIILSERFFKDSVSSYFMLIFLFTYILHFAYDTVGDNYKTDNNKTSKITIDIKDNILDEKNKIIINSNSNYFFLHDTVESRSYIVDKSNIKMIKVE